MTLRDKRQQEFAEKWLKTKFGILYLTARFGKIKTSVNIFKEFPKDCKILICYPDNQIKKSWKEDFEKWEYSNKNVIFTTYRSLEKHVDKYDIVVFDEIHLMSENNFETAKLLLNRNKNILGLTGTLSRKTIYDINYHLSLPIVAKYSIEEAIREGVIADYHIYVVKVPLDDKVIEKRGSKRRTEKQYFKAVSWVIDQKTKKGQDVFFLRLNRMRIIQNSLAKLNKTKELLQKFKDDRVLVFCGVTKIADKLGIPVHHSKKTDEKAFQDFTNGKGNHLGVIKIGNTGVTYKPLNKIIINYFNSNSENLTQKINRAMAMEYNNPNKKAEIYIISSNESVELNWLNKSLEFFNKQKITYL